jgi:hypothetical protein
LFKAIFQPKRFYRYPTPVLPLLSNLIGNRSSRLLPGITAGFCMTWRTFGKALALALIGQAVVRIALTDAIGTP